MADPIRVTLNVQDASNVPLTLQPDILPRLIEGISPAVTLEETAGGVIVTITDKNGTHTALVPKGDKGDPGADGADGAPGADGKDGQDGAPGADGQPGADGFSPTATVTKSGSVTTITVTDKNGTTTATVNDGAALIDDTAGAGDTDKAWSADKSASEVGSLLSAIQQKYTKPNDGIPASDLASGVIPSVPVTDVQVNGTSVLNNGVANVPVASESNLGLVKTAGTGIYVNATGEMSVVKATSAQIKAATANFVPIVPSSQHESAFYGLAKVAGADMSSSSNAVGTYTDAAKKAIRNMLGAASGEWELIADYTVAENSAQVNVNTDTNGQPFELSKMYVRVWLEPSTTGSNDFVSAYSLVKKTDDGASVTSLTTNKYLANGAKTYMEYTGELIVDMHIGRGKAAIGEGATATLNQISSAKALSIKAITGFRLSQYYSGTTTLIPKDSVIKIYGIRK